MNEFARPNLAVTDLPPAGASDSGKVLTADATGVPIWAVPDPASVFPELPETDGAYVLTVTVDDGEATYSWESTAEQPEDNSGGK